MFYNVLGSIAWVASMILTGFYLGENTWVKQNFEKIILGFGVFTLVPILYKMFGKKRSPTLVIGKEVVEEQFGLNDTKEK